MRWLVLRGLAREQGHWERLPDLPGTVHALDLPGAGTEHRRRSPADIAGIAEDVRERWLALRDAGADGWGLLAVSLGGMVAMQWCADHPEDFARLVLVNTSGGNLCAPWKRLRPRMVPHIARGLVERDLVARERRILWMTTRMQGDVDAIARRRAEVSRSRPMSRANFLRQLYAAARFRAPSRLVPKVLVLSGAEDRLTHPDCPRRVAGHFSARLEVHPSAGHDLTLDDPGWLAERVRAWLAAA